MADLWLRDTDRDELINEIVEKVVTTLKDEFAKSGTRLVDRYAMADLLGISEATVTRLVRDRKIPSKLIGSRRVFNPDDVIAALPDES